MKPLWLLLLLACASPVLAQGQDFSKVEELVTPLGAGLYALTGSGGNTTVAVGTDGIIVVDTQFSPLHDKIKARISGFSHLPVKYVINTHFHGDHTGGNAAFAKEGAVIVAYKTLGERLSHPLPGADGQPGTPAPAEALPTRPYDTATSSVAVGGLTADLLHPMGSHTDTDTVVFFKSANVIATGDTVTSASYPNIDVAAGGSIDGMIANADTIIARADAATKIVPGHGPVTDKAGVMEYRAMLQTARDRIAKAKASGMSEQQMADANLLADLDVKWKANASALQQRFPRLVYQSVK